MNPSGWFPVLDWALGDTLVSTFVSRFSVPVVLVIAAGIAQYVVRSFISAARS